MFALEWQNALVVGLVLFLRPRAVNCARFVRPSASDAVSRRRSILLNKSDVNIEAGRMGFRFNRTIRRSSKLDAREKSPSGNGQPSLSLSLSRLVANQMWRIDKSNAIESRTEQRMSHCTQSFQILPGDQWTNGYSQDHR